MTTTDAQRGTDDDQSHEEPLVSVVIPTYGRDPAQFRAAVESVRGQTYGNVELVVVDDSPDEVSVWLDDRDWFPAVTRVRGRDHDGAAAARNTGIWRSSGEFIAFLDDDDRWYPEKLERQVATFRDAPADVGVVYTALEYVRDGRVLRQSDATLSGDVTRALLSGANLGTFSTLMIRESLLPRAGFVDHRLPILEDREWCLRLSRHCQFASISEPLVRYCQGDHEQLTDGYEQLRDVAVPLFEGKHRDLAAAYGAECERAFCCALRRVCAASALSSGRYADGRKFALRALGYRPTDRRAWMYLLAALGDEYTHRPLRRARHCASRLLDRIPNGDDGCAALTGWLP